LFDWLFSQGSHWFGLRNRESSPSKSILPAHFGPVQPANGGTFYLASELAVMVILAALGSGLQFGRQPRSISPSIQNGICPP
jgi:hypothetical protein